MVLKLQENKKWATEVEQAFQIHYKNIGCLSLQIKVSKKMVFFCAMGFRSALATKTLIDMGFVNVANAQGGFDALKNAGLEVVQKEKK